LIVIENVILIRNHHLQSLKGVAGSDGHI
jgi:hypothetical protein